METNIDKELIKIVIYCVSGIIITILIAFSIVGGIAFSKIEKGAGKSFGLLFRRGNFLRIFTVLLIVQAVIILSVLNLLGTGAIAILSGIAGYVLGGLEKSKDQIEV